MTTPITADHTIAQWLNHPTGGPVLREMLAQGGQDESSLSPVRSMPLSQMAALAPEQMPPSLVEQLIRAANGGEIPESTDAPAPSWQERVVEGRFAGRTVIVTGAASGIGRATASRVAREGGRVVAVDLAQERLEELRGSLAGVDVVPVRADITSEEDVARVVEAAGGRVDGLTNIAGIMDGMEPLHEVDDAVWQRVMAVNLDGTMRLTRAVLPLMLQAGHGSVVNTASEAGLRGSAAGVAYTASKHAVIGLTRSCAFMYADKGIRVNAVAPGAVATGIEATRRSEFSGPRMALGMQLIPSLATAEQLAATITFLLSDDGVNINGAILPSDGGWSAA